LTLRTFYSIWLFVLAALAVGVRARADGPFRYPEAKHGKGELKYVNRVPVLIVQGSPEEIGEQVGVLALKPASGLMKLADQFIQAQGWERLYPVLLKTGNLMIRQFPPDQQFTVADVAKQMDAVHHGTATVQTMVLEPSPLKLHIAFGKGPATRLPLRTIDLTELLTTRKYTVSGWHRHRPRVRLERMLRPCYGGIAFS
jgi:hypothetical protein